jgi:hypothetical protein
LTKTGYHPSNRSYLLSELNPRDGGHEQLISNGGRFKPAFAEIDEKQTMIDLRGISANWFGNHICPSIRLSRAPNF